MKKIKNFLVYAGIITAFLAIIGGIGFVKYKIWRAEHPNGATWTFFIPSGRK